MREIFITTLCGLLSIGALLPVLPIYVTEELGLGNVSVGFVIGAYALTGIAFRPIAGWLADHRGRRLVVIIGSLTTAVAGTFLFLPLGFASLVASRLLLGAGEGAVFTAGSAWVVDLAPPARRARLVGLYGLSVWTGLSIGPLIGQTLFQVGGFNLVWAFAIAGPLFAALFASRIPDPFEPKHVEGQRRKLIAREALGPGTAMALASVGYAAIASFIVLHLRAQGVGHGALVFSTFAAALVITRVIAGGLPDKIGPRHVAAVAAVLEAAGLALIALGGGLASDVAGAVIMGTAYSVLYPSLSLIVIERVPPSRRGAALGTFTGAFDFGVGIGAPLVGAVSALTDYSGGFLFAAILALLPAFAYLFAIARHRPGVA
jgi:MFS family permease